jgi:iron complex outermembrane receptor protein
MKTSLHPATRVMSLAAALAALSLPLSAQDSTPAPLDKDEEVVTLSEFQVTAAAEDGYRASNALSGTRFKTDLIDLPKAVDVITEEFIADIGALDMYDALRFTGGVESNGASGTDDVTGNNFVLRGISAQTTTYRNGYRSFGRTDPIMVQRIEVIRGPSSVFSGPIEPGGTINIITKRPTKKELVILKARYGTYDRFRSEAVYNTPIGDGKKAAVRVALAHENFGHMQDFAGHEKTVFGLAADYKVSKKGAFSFDFQYLQMFTEPAAGIPYLNSSVTNSTISGLEPNVSRTFNRQGPDAYSDNIQIQTNLDYVHTFSDTISLHAGVYYRVQDLKRLLVGGSTRITTSTVTGRRTAARVATYEPNAVSWVVTPQIYLLGKFNYAGIDHSAIVGYDYSYSHARNDIFQATLPGLDIDNAAPADYSLGNFSSYAVNELRRTKDSDQGVSVSNTFGFWNGRAFFLQGFRFGSVDGTRERLEIADPAARSQSAKNSATAQSYGLSIRLVDRISAFVSYSESFVPQSIGANTSYDYLGNLLDPISGEGWDLGLKFDIKEGVLSGSLVAFDITRANAPTPDPDFPGYFIADAESQARGVEFNLNGRLTKNIQVVGSYAYIDAKITQDTRAERIGWRSSNVPRHQSTVWVNYSFRDGWTKGLKASLGVIYKANRRGNNTLADLPGLQLPGYTRYDGRLGYETKIKGRKVGFNLSAQNITDIDYQASANGYGEARTVTGTVSVQF